MTIGKLAFNLILALHNEHHRVNLAYPDDVETRAYKDGMYFAERKLLELYDGKEDADPSK